MSDKFNVYTPIITDLASEAITCSPANWTKGTLYIDCDGRQINYALKNNEEEGTAVISQELAQLCEKLYVAFAQNETQPWTRCTLNFYQTENKEWKMTSDFEYPPAN